MGIEYTAGFRYCSQIRKLCRAACDLHVKNTVPPANASQRGHWGRKPMGRHDGASRPERPNAVIGERSVSGVDIWRPM